MMILVFIPTFVVFLYTCQTHTSILSMGDLIFNDFSSVLTIKPCSLQHTVLSIYHLQYFNQVEVGEPMFTARNCLGKM